MHARNVNSATSLTIFTNQVVKMSRCMWTFIGLLVVAATVLYTEGKKKSVLDYNDADVERIFREWEVREIKA